MPMKPGESRILMLFYSSPWVPSTGVFIPDASESSFSLHSITPILVPVGHSLGSFPPYVRIG